MGYKVSKNRQYIGLFNCRSFDEFFEKIGTVLLVSLVAAASAFAEATSVDLLSETTKVIVSPPSSGKIATHNYQSEILRMALDQTVETHGSFEFTTAKINLKNLRALEELKKPNGIVNAHITTTSITRENEAIPIRVPIRLGVLNYRLLLVNRANLDMFDHVRTAEDLKKLKAGVVYGWVTTEILEAKEFRTVKSHSSHGIFKMLNNERFDYLPRGVHQIYSELENIGNELDNVVIEPNLAIYLVVPFYVFVSPSQPKLAQRLEVGLEAIVADGSLKKVFNEYYGSAIEKAGLERRHVIYIDNPLLPEKTPVGRSEFWFFHDSDFASSINMATAN